jgi:predicted CXXCH cytochrome family protein
MDPHEEKATARTFNENRKAAMSRWLACLIAGLLLPVILVVANSCTSSAGQVVVPLSIPGAHYVGNEACAYCHKDYVRIFAASPHARIHFNWGLTNDQAGCESCHGPGSKHIEAGGGEGKFIINPGKDPSACFQCHQEVQSEFNLPQHHPLIEGHMNCVQCHDPHGRDIFKPAGGLAMARLNETCAQCHREQTRPFVFEHEAMREGCTTCHNPHGSINRKLLVDPDANLCLRCHAQVQDGSGTIFIGGIDHSSMGSLANLSRATCWASGCHTAVHGSNVDPWLRY